MSSPAPEGGERPLPAPRRGRRAAAVWALTVLALSAGISSASAAERTTTVLVKVDPDAAREQRRDVSRALRARAVRPLVAGWRAYELPAAVTQARAERLLSGEPAAEAVQIDTRVTTAETPDDPYFGHQWALPAIDAPAGWGASAGAAPVVVAVIDTGVQTDHPDLAGRMWVNDGEIPGNGIDDDGNGYVDDVAGWNFFADSNVVYDPAHGDSHGTHVAGTIAARRGNAIGVAGVADNARIMPLKFLMPQGGYTSDAISAIQYAVANGARIINASWGGPTYSEPLCDAIELAGQSGVLFVVAAGNGGADGVGDDNDAVPAWPANCEAPNLVSVAATTPGDGLAGFSNFGALRVDLGAPGTDVLSTIPHLTYGYKSGTSMAAPHVTGVAAVVLGMHPDLAPWQLKAALTSGGDPASALVGTTRSGRRVDLAGALAAAAAGIGADVTPPDPFAALAPADGFATSAPGAPVFSWAPASDAQSGVAGYRLVVGGVPPVAVGPGVRSASPAPVPDGVHHWRVEAIDGVGNVRATPPRTLVVDRTPPTPPQPQSPAPGARVEGPAVDLAWGPSQDAVTGVASYRVLVDGAVAATTPAALRSVRVGLGTGAHTWQVVAVDGLGNASASSPRSVTVTGRTTSSRAVVRLRRVKLLKPRRRSPSAVPRLRVRLRAPARLTVTVHRGPRARTMARFRVRARAGVSPIRIPRRVERRMRARGRYVVTVRASSRARDSVRFVVRARKR